MTDLNHHYETLGLKPGASPADVKQAYRALAKTWHPDRYAHDPRLKQQAEEKIKAINIAYAHLKDYQPSLPPPQVAQPASSPYTSVSRKPTSAEIFYERGAAHAKAGRFQEAVEAFTAAIRLNPNYAEAYRHRGFVYSLMGLELGADADLRKAKQLGLGRSTQVKSSRPVAPSPVPPPARSSGWSNPFTSKSSRPPLSPPASAWRLVRTLPGHQDSVLAIALSADGNTAMSGGLDQTLRVWHLRSTKAATQLTGHRAGIGAIALSCNGQLVASGSQDGQIYLWHLPSGSLIRTLEGHRQGITAIVFAPDHQRLVSASLDGTIRFWSAAQGQTTRLVEGASSMAVLSLAVSRDGQLVISGTADRTLNLYHLKSGELLRVLTGSSAALTAVAISPDGQVLASGGSDGRIKLWYLTKGLPTQLLPGHTETVRSLAFSPDGQTLFSASEDGTIKLWQVKTGEMQRLLTGHTAAVTAIALSADGTTLLSGSRDTTLRLWSASP